MFHRFWHDAHVIACTEATTCANQEKGGLGGLWKAHSKVKQKGVISPVQYPE